MKTAPRVLVIDGLSETEAVLRAVLEPRGLRVDCVRANSHGNFAEDSTRPSVVVLHVDETHGETGSAENWKNVPRVIIGSTPAGGRRESSGCERHLPKPFQYRELIQAIERLLGSAAA